MRIGRWLIASLAFTMALAGCTPNEAFRKTAAIPAVACTADTAAALPDPCRRAITETTADYDLHFVEFDDQGWTYPDAALIGHDPTDQSSQHRAPRH
jgi:hypothetical protein